MFSHCQTKLYIMFVCVCERGWGEMLAMTSGGGVMDSFSILNVEKSIQFDMIERSVFMNLAKQQIVLC